MASGSSSTSNFGAMAPDATSVSLIEGIRIQSPDAWRRFAAIYGPLIYRWCRHVGVARSEAADVSQQVFRSVIGHVARLLVLLPQLEWLILFGTTIGDTSLEKLAESAGRQDTRLKRLALNGCHIGDAALEKLAALHGLEALYLSGTDVTDAGLNHLHRLTNLKLLDLTDTQTTAAGAAALKTALPGCEVKGP
jgi:hypothetical protein